MVLTLFGCKEYKCNNKVETKENMFFLINTFLYLEVYVIIFSNLRLSKSLISTQAPTGMERAGGQVERGLWMSGFQCYGVFIGSDAYDQHMLGQVISKVCKEVMHLLRNDIQAAWVILFTAMSHQLEYSLTFQNPSNVLKCAVFFGHL